VVAIPVLRAITPQGPHPYSWPVVILVALGAGVFAYALHWVTSFLRSEIVFSEKGINRRGFQNGMVQLQFWSWERIAHVRFATAIVNKQEFPVLALHDAGDSVIERFCLSPTVPEAQLRDELKRYGKEVRS